MNDFIRILRDPDPNAGGGGAGAGTQDPPAPANDIPKTKEEWDKLAETNPKRWIELTQPRMDQAVRESREWKQKATDNENRLKNTEAELVNLRKGSQPPPAQPPAGPDPNKPFSRDNMPQTDQDWDRLFIEDPKLATDLRVEAANQQRINRDRQVQVQEEFNKSRKGAAKELWDRHPDMFEPEVDTDGVTPKKDASGKVILKRDQNGSPILDLRSEKGKLFDEVYNEDAMGFESSKIGPRLVMLEMERRLVAKGNQQVQAGQSGQPGSTQQGQSGAAAPDQRGTLPGGVQPPVTAKVSFATDEEKSHAERAVQRGVYKNLEEYCLLRDGKNTGIVEENRTPQFK